MTEDQSGNLRELTDEELELVSGGFPGGFLGRPVIDQVTVVYLGQNDRVVAANKHSLAQIRPVSLY